MMDAFYTAQAARLGRQTHAARSPTKTRTQLSRHSLLLLLLLTMMMMMLGKH